MRKILLRIIRELNPTIFLIEKLSFSLKLLSGFFIGNPSLRLSEVLVVLTLFVILA